jgi:hypothetical protein
VTKGAKVTNAIKASQLIGLPFLSNKNHCQIYEFVAEMKTFIPSFPINPAHNLKP